MSLYIASIASGSNGNCYYIGNSNEAVLIDAGISCRETEKRMERMGLSMKTVKALFISHEHSDHISGVSVLARKYALPVYVTPGTAHGGRLNLSASFFLPFAADEPVAVGELLVTPFIKHHDAWDPHSFTVSGNGVTIGIFTDLGKVCTNLVHHFSQCHAAFLEANYDDIMLEQGRYPYHLKNRIRGGKGHLSNKQALKLFRQFKAPYMSHLLLSHLSRDNNDPQLALELFQEHAGNVNVTVASRYKESAVYHITEQGGKHIFEGIPQSSSQSQLSLF